MSSITEPMCGSSAQISVWFAPNFANGCCGPKHISFAPCSCASCWPFVMLSGMGWPSNCSEFRLGVEGFQMRRAARHAEPDDALGLLTQWQPIEDAAQRFGCRCCARRCDATRLASASAAQALRAATEERAPRELLGLVLIQFRTKIHGLLYERVMVSWRFSSTRATCVQAASSALSIAGGTGARPVFSNASAEAAFGVILAESTLRASPASSSFHPSLGLRCSDCCQAHAIRSSVVPWHSLRMRAAKTRAASTYVGSFSSTSACCGMFERVRSAVHASRLEASNASSDGWGNVRCRQV